MAVNIFEMFGKIGADDKPAMDAIDRVVGHARTANNSLSNGLNSMGSFFTGIGNKLTSNITKPAVGAASALTGITLVKGFNRLVGIDEAKAKLLGLGHDAKGVEEIMKSALESVKGTSFGMDEAATTAANAVAAGIQPGQELTKYLKLTGDAAAIAGVSMSEMGSIVNKVTTSGRAMTENLEQLSDRGLPIYQWLGKEAGVAADQVKGLASSGKISSEMFMAAIEKNIGGAAAIIGENSFKASLANMWASVGRIGANFLDAGGKGGGFFSQLKPLIGEATNLLSGLESKAADFGAKFGEVFKQVIDFVLQLKTKFDELSPAMQQATLKSVGLGAAFAVGIGPALQMFGAFFSILAPVAQGLGTISLIAASALTGAGQLVGMITPIFSQVLAGATGFLALGSSAITSVVGKTASALSVIMKLALAVLAPAAVGGALLAGLGVMNTLFGDQINQMIQLAITQGPQIIGSLTEKIREGLPALIMSGAELLAGFGQAFTTNLPAIFELATTLITSLVQGVTQSLPLLIPMAIQIVGGLATGIITALPQLLLAGLDLLQGLINGIVQNIPLLATTALDIVTNLGTNLQTNLPTILQKGIEILVSLINGIVQAIPQLIPIVVQLITIIANAILSNLPTIIKGGIQILTALINGVIQLIPQLIPMVVQIFSAILNAIVTNLPKILEAGITLLGKLASGIIQAIPELVAQLPKIFTEIVSAIGSMDWLSIGKNIIDGIAKGISNFAGSIVDAAKNAASSAYDKAREFLEVNSPSKKFMRGVGGPISEGIAVGVTKEAYRIQDALTDTADNLTFDPSFGQVLDPNQVVTQGYTAQPNTIDSSDQIVGVLGNMLDVLYALLQKDQNTYLDSQQLVDGMKRKMSVALNQMNEQQSINNGVVPKPI